MSDSMEVLTPESYRELLFEPHSHALRYFERSSERKTSDEADCVTSFGMAMLESARNLGLELSVSIVSSDVTFRIRVGLQFLFERDLKLSREVYSDFLSEVALPAVMPIATTWVLQEIATVQPDAFVEVPFTDAYPFLSEQIRAQVHEIATNEQPTTTP